MNVARHVLPVLREQGHGSLVLVGSVIGHIAAPGMTAYAVSKWGVRALARQLQLENRDAPVSIQLRRTRVASDTPIYEQAANYAGWAGRPPPPCVSPAGSRRSSPTGSTTPASGSQVGPGERRHAVRLQPRSRGCTTCWSARSSSRRPRRHPAPGPAPRQRPGVPAGAEPALGDQVNSARRRSRRNVGGPPQRPGRYGAVTGHDAVVVGAGPNGLVAANYLADAGWSVLVLEAQPDVGGAVRSDSEVHPGFVHDTFSAFYPLAAPRRPSSPSGSRSTGWSGGTPRPCSGTPSRTASGRSSTATASAPRPARPRPPRRRRRVARARRQWDRIGDAHRLGAARPVPAGACRPRRADRLRSVGGLEFVRLMLTPVTDIGRNLFGGVAPGSCWPATPATPTSRSTPRVRRDGDPAGDAGPDRRLPGPRGRRRPAHPGAGRAASSRWAARSGSVRGGRRRRGGTPRCRRTHRRRALRGAARAVLADVVASNLYGKLLAPDDVPPQLARACGPSSSTPGRSRSTGRSTVRSRGRRARATRPARSTSPTPSSR